MIEDYDRLRNNTYLNLNDVKCNSLLDLISNYEKSCNNGKSSIFRSKILSYLETMDTINVEFINFLHLLSKETGCSVKFYFDFMTIYNITTLPDALYKPPKRNVILSLEQKLYLKELESEINSAISYKYKLPPDKITISTPNDLSGSRKSKRSNFISYISMMHRTPLEIITYCIDKNLSMNTMLGIVKWLTSGKSLSSGIVPSVVDSKLKLRIFKSKNEMLLENFLK